MDIKEDLMKVLQYKNGKSKQLTENESKSIIEEIDKIIQENLEMPCFYVSLNEDILNSLKNDEYIEFIYNKVKNHNGLKYERLLWKAQENVNFINFTRFYNGRYEGRNIYFESKNNILSIK